MVYCHKCGEEVEETHHFCSNCGEEVSVGNSPSNDTEVTDASIKEVSETLTNDKEEKKYTISRIIAWIGGIFIIVFGITLLVNSPIGGLFVLAAGVFALPITRKHISENQGVTFSKWLVTAIVIVGVAIGGSMAPMGGGSDQASASLDGDESEDIQVRILYDGSWQGAAGGEGNTRSIEGQGDETIDIDDDANVVSVNAQKMDSSSKKLTVQILLGDEVVAEESTTASHGVAQVSESMFG